MYDSLITVMIIK